MCVCRRQDGSRVLLIVGLEVVKLCRDKLLSASDDGEAMMVFGSYLQGVSNTDTQTSHKGETKVGPRPASGSIRTVAGITETHWCVAPLALALCACLFTLAQTINVSLLLQKAYEDFGAITNETVINRRRQVRLRVVQKLQVSENAPGQPGCCASAVSRLSPRLAHGRSGCFPCFHVTSAR